MIAAKRAAIDRRHVLRVHGPALRPERQARGAEGQEADGQARALLDELARQGRHREPEGLAVTGRGSGIRSPARCPSPWIPRRSRERSPRRARCARRRSRAAGSRSASPASSRTTASTSRRSRARCTRCSARTAPARARSRTSSPASTAPTRARSRSTGEPVAFHTPRDALDAGIGMVHQHFRLVEPFTVAENVDARRPRATSAARSGSTRARSSERVAELGERYGLAVDPRARIWQLSVGEQQRVEILKALYREARILILDEPTAVLTPAGGASAVRDAAGDGCRRPDGDLHLAQAARGDGGRRPRHGAARRPLGRRPSRPRDATPQSLAALMVGRELRTYAPRGTHGARDRRGRARARRARRREGDRGVGGGEGRLADGARRRDPRRRGRGRQRAARAGRGGHRAAPAHGGRDPRRRRAAARRRSARCDHGRHRPRPGGPAAHRCRAEPQHRLERRAQVLPRPRRTRPGRSSGSAASATGPSS